MLVKQINLVRHHEEWFALGVESRLLRLACKLGILLNLHKVKACIRSQSVFINPSPIVGHLRMQYVGMLGKTELADA